MNKRVVESGLIGLSALTLTGFGYKPEIEVPTKVESVKVSSVNNEEVVYFDDLDDINVYLEYLTNSSGIMYGAAVLKEVDTDDYTAYYNYKTGKLVSVDFDKELSTLDKLYYTKYLLTDYIKLSSLEEQLYSPYYTDIIKDDVNYEEAYVEYDALKNVEKNLESANRVAYDKAVDTAVKTKALKK